jgi:hypothetical protein
MPEFVLIIGVVLRNVGGDVKAHGEGQIRLRPHHLLQKLDRGLLLKLETLPDGRAGINHDAYTQRQIRLLGEIENLRGRLLIIQEGEISLLQILNEPSVLVSDGEDQVHLVDVGPDGEIAIVLSVGGLATTRGMGHGAESAGLVWRGWRSRSRSLRTGGKR